jgi:hypothetical protein
MKRQPDWPALLLLIAIFFGGLVRFMPALLTRFPLNDGGMFYTMSQELSANRYALPAVTSYNGLDLPFAYPPLGLYLASLLADFGRLPLLGVFLWLPPLLSVLSIPAFYFLASALLPDKLRASLATIFFALTPGSYDWNIMGGGVTRSVGFFFLLLAALYVLRFFREADRKLILPAILFCSFAVLSHPEVGLQTAGLCAVFWLFFGRTWHGTLSAFIIVLGVTLLTAPWWGTVIAQHGLVPFLSALQTGQHATVSWLALLIGLFSNDEFLPLLLILWLTGFAFTIWKKQYLLPALVFVPALLDPRSAASISFLPLSMLAALGFLDAIPALLKKLQHIEIDPILTHRSGALTLILLTFTLFVECGLLNFRLINTTLTPDERSAMTWLRDNLSPDQDFLLLTGRTYSMSDPVQEWFPTFTGQRSQSTLQGLEWTLAAQFEPRLNQLVSLQSCSDLACVDAFKERTGVNYQFLWVSPSPLDAAYSESVQSLLKSIRTSDRFRLIYNSESVLVFEQTGE